MDKEPYRVAKELLEKYDPSHAALQPTTPQPQQQGISHVQCFQLKE